jgi:chemotaxis protein methyltransferase CheR
MKPSLDPYRHLTFLGEDVIPAAPTFSRVARQPLARPSLALDANSAAFFDVLCEEWGLVAARYRNSILARRQAACLRALRATSAAEAARRIAQDPDAAERALGAVMIGVTAFFRDAGAFESLRRELVRMKGQSAPFTGMSIGCSDGSELYSLAILLAEAGMLDGARLRGLDCRPAAIRAARAGVYGPDAIAGVSAERLLHFFVPVPAYPRLPFASGARPPRMQVAPRFQAACEWVVADAFRLPLEPHDAELHDVIMCRNLAIYLEQQSVTELWVRCLAHLKPGGLLMTGKAERPPMEVRGALRRAGPSLYRRDQ